MAYPCFATINSALIGAVALLTLSACTAKTDSKAPDGETAPVSAPPAMTDTEATAYFISNDRANIGKVLLTQTSTGILATIEIEGLTPGEHGMHFHVKGDCADAEFKNSGGHINPDGKMHGLHNAQGPDNADMPNLVVDESGRAVQTVGNDRLSFYGEGGRPALFDADGSAMIIHANADDQVSQPIGGAGARVACAVITAP